MKKKAKTHSGAKKRLSRTGTGKIKKAKVNKRHILTHKSRNRKRGLAKSNTVDRVDQRHLDKLIPYL